MLVDGEEVAKASRVDLTMLTERDVLRTNWKLTAILSVTTISSLPFFRTSLGLPEPFSAGSRQRSGGETWDSRYRRGLSQGREKGLRDSVTSIALLGAETWAGKVYGAEGWQHAQGGVAVVTEPATGESLGEIGVANAADMAAAAEAAKRAQEDWAALSFETRATVLRKAAQILEEAEDEAITWLVREAGSIPPKAGVEMHGVINEVWQAAAMPAQPIGEVLPAADPSKTSLAVRVPVGVVGVIAPFNFPAILAMRSVAPALATGNAVILKPDPNTAVCGGVLIARAFEEAGLPPGVLQVLPGGPEPGRQLACDPNVGMISFTGSTAVGRLIGELAGKHLKKVALELGGNSAYIVLDDANLDAAASSGAWGSFLHQGQICMTTGRHLVHESIVDAYVERLTEKARQLAVGDPHREKVALGPLISERQADRVDSIVQDTVAAGADLRTGGRGDGAFYRPTVLADVKAEMRAWREEIFGPVAPVMSFATDDEAVEIANASEYGLAAGIHTASVSRGMTLARRLKTGIVHINDQTVADEAQAPFGGVNSSGNGARFGGTANWDQFTEWRWITIRSEQSTYPF